MCVGREEVLLPDFAVALGAVGAAVGARYDGARQVCSGVRRLQEPRLVLHAELFVPAQENLAN